MNADSINPELTEISAIIHDDQNADRLYRLSLVCCLRNIGFHTDSLNFSHIVPTLLTQTIFHPNHLEVADIAEQGLRFSVDSFIRVALYARSLMLCDAISNKRRLWLGLIS